MKPINLQTYRRVVFFTGAGMSAESGVPTYRGHGGIWHQYNFEDYACQRAFDRCPERVLEFHELRRKVVLGCAPHAGHLYLAQLQQAHPCLEVITQNIDGLLQRAGVRVAAELHGSLWRLRCRCGARMDTDAAAYTHRKCPTCLQWLRPDVTWFGDRVDQGVFDCATKMVGDTDLFVSVGTSGAVWPAARFARQAEIVAARMIEINPEENDASIHYREHVRVQASEAISQMFLSHADMFHK